MKTKKWLVISVMILILAIIFSGFFVGKYMLADKRTSKPFNPVQNNND